MNSNNGTVRGDALATVSPGMLPPPFTVRWSTKSNCWVVWMPETDDLLMIDGTFISITGISAAPELPSGWYTVDDLVPGSDSIYLVITITDSTESATAVLSGAQGTSSSGETVYNIKIASMSTDPNTNEKSIEQYTNSSVIMVNGGVLTDTAPSDAVLSTGTALVGSSTEAARADHVHKLPNTVVDTVHTQTINGSKRFTKTVVVGGNNASESTDPRIVLYKSGSIELHGSESAHIDFHYAVADIHTSRIVESSSGVLELNSPNHARLTQSPIVDPNASDYNARQIATVGVVKIKQTAVSDPTPSGTAKAFIDSISQNANGEITVTKKNVDIPAPPSGTVKFIGDMRWNMTTHTLQKRLDSLNMATGAVAQGAWSDITNGGTTPISSILTQSS